MALKVPFIPRINGSGVVTYQGTASGQAIFWRLVGWNPDTETEVEPVGSLSKSVTVTDKTRCATNVYTAPTVDPSPVYDKLRVTTVS